MLHSLCPSDAKLHLSILKGLLLRDYFFQERVFVPAIRVWCFPFLHTRPFYLSRYFVPPVWPLSSKQKLSVGKKPCPFVLCGSGLKVFPTYQQHQIQLFLIDRHIEKSNQNRVSVFSETIWLLYLCPPIHCIQTSQHSLPTGQMTSSWQVWRVKKNIILSIKKCDSTIPVLGIHTNWIYVLVCSLWLWSNIKIKRNSGRKENLFGL